MNNSFTDTLHKRSGSKFLSNSIALTCYRELKNSLLPLDEGKSFLKEVKKLLNCSEKIFIENNNTGFKQHFCKSRFCLICNRNRAGEMINRYSPIIETIEDKKFISLSLRNCKPEHLRNNINAMYDAFYRIRKNLLKTYKVKIEYIKKIEVTENEKRRDMHPHFHIFLKEEKIKINWNNKNYSDVSDLLRDMWLKQFPVQAGSEGQEVKAWTYGNGLEMFKYFTKFITKDKRSTKEKPMYKVLKPLSLMRIHHAIKGKRIFETTKYFRKRECKKTLSEVSTAIRKQAQRLAWLSFHTETNKTYHYDYNQRNYINNSTGEFLTNYIPSEFLIKHLKDHNYRTEYNAANYQPFRFYQERDKINVLGNDDPGRRYDYLENEIERLKKCLLNDIEKGRPAEMIQDIKDKIALLQFRKYAPVPEKNSEFSCFVKKLNISLSRSRNKKLVYQKYKLN